MRKHWRIIIATIFSAGCIVAAFYLAHSFDTPTTAQASTETALLQQLATKDSDHDGLPDWEEALYGTDPNNPDTFNLGMTDGEAVAKGLIVPKAVADIPEATSTVSTNLVDGVAPPANGTLTASLVQDFMSRYEQMKEQSGGADLTSDQINSIAESSLQDVLGSVSETPAYKSISDLTVSGSGPTALTNFAASVEAIFSKNMTNATSSELAYLIGAASSTPETDSFYITELSAIAKSYRSIASGISILPVPSEIEQGDLEFINAIARLSTEVSDFSRIDSDSISAMIAVGQYLPTVQSLQQSLIDLDVSYANEHVSIASGTPGSYFVGLLNRAAAEGPLVIPQATSTTP